jgi:uncharacterized protein
MPNNLPMKEFIVSLLKEKLPLTYYYHNYEHTAYVLEKTVEIGRHENCTTKEIELLIVAALWHDSGYINTYAGHEEESCVLARRYLPDYGFSSGDINSICGMIMATKIPQTPKTRLEEIIADADMEYLGTPHAAAQAENLFREWHHLNPSLTKEKWNQIQIDFIQQHHYFTSYCKQQKEQPKQVYLDKLKKEIQ